jgi:hypothetical protein
MGIKPTDTRSRRRATPEVEDTAVMSLSKIDRKKMNMDSWEPSLLRKLLKAQNRLKHHK